MSTQLDDVAQQLEAVRLNGRIKAFAEQQYEDAGEPDTILDYQPVLDSIETALGLVETVEANPDEPHPRQRLREQVGQLREHAQFRYKDGVVPDALEQIAAALTAWDDGNAIDLDAVRHNLQQAHTATKTLQEAHELLVEQNKNVQLS